MARITRVVVPFYPRIGVPEHTGPVRRAHPIGDDFTMPHVYPVIDPDYRRRIRLWERACPRIGVPETP